MLRALLVARKLNWRAQSRATLQTLAKRRFASGESRVSIHSLAVYIHEQINGTFDDIFEKLSERVGYLEYPNNGSSTQVTLEDAKVIVEDIGAHADELEGFLEDDKHLEKAVGFHKEPENLDGQVRLSQSDFMTTEDLLRSHFTAGSEWYLVQNPLQGLCSVLTH